jgi:hypothetical protein
MQGPVAGYHKRYYVLVATALGGAWRMLPATSSTRFVNPRSWSLWSFWNVWSFWRFWISSFWNFWPRFCSFWNSAVSGVSRVALNPRFWYPMMWRALSAGPWCWEPRGSPRWCCCPNARTPRTPLATAATAASRAPRPPGRYLSNKYQTSLATSSLDASRLTRQTRGHHAC